MLQIKTKDANSRIVLKEQILMKLVKKKLRQKMWYMVSWSIFDIGTLTEPLVTLAEHDKRLHHAELKMAQLEVQNRVVTP